MQISAQVATKFGEPWSVHSAHQSSRRGTDLSREHTHKQVRNQLFIFETPTESLYMSMCETTLQVAIFTKLVNPNIGPQEVILCRGREGFDICALRVIIESPQSNVSGCNLNNCTTLELSMEHSFRCYLCITEV